MPKKDPYGNRVREIMKWKAPEEVTPFTIKDGFTAAHSWELPRAYCAIIRAVKLDGTIEERAYRDPHAANRFMAKCLEEESDFPLLTDDTIRDTVTHEQPYDY